MKNLLLSLLIMLIAVSCSDHDPVKNQLTLSSLIGGKQVEKNEFPATIMIKNSCTASKISEKTFITAAHCVTDRKTAQIKEQYLKNSSIEINDLSSNRWHTLTIDKVIVPETYLEKMNRFRQWGQGGHYASYWASDLALIKVMENTPSIATAKLSLTPIKENNEVIMVGTGCEFSAMHSIELSERRLKAHPVRTLGADSISDYPSLNERIHPDLERNFKINFITEGKFLNDQSASLCPGDSGGPVYLLEDGEYKIVGINSYYTFSDGGNISRTNLHARLNNIDLKVLLEEEAKELIYLKDEIKKMRKPFASLQKYFSKIYSSKAFNIKKKSASISIKMKRPKVEKRLGKPMFSNLFTESVGYESYVDVVWRSHFKSGMKPWRISYIEGYQGTLQMPGVGKIKLGDDLSKLIPNKEAFNETMRVFYNETYGEDEDYNCHETTQCRWYDHRELSFLFLVDYDNQVEFSFSRNQKALRGITFYQTDW